MNESYLKLTPQIDKGVRIGPYELKSEHSQNHLNSNYLVGFGPERCMFGYTWLGW